MLALDQDRVIAAAERGARQFCELLGTARDPDARAIGTWRVRDVGAHLTGVSAYTAMLRGVPSPVRSIDDIAGWNASNVAAVADLDCAGIAARVADAYREFLAEARRHPGDDLVGWHGGLRLPSSALCAVLAGEAYVHGWDIAQALGRSWPLDPDDMCTTFIGLLPVLPHYVDPGGANGLTATFDIRLRGDPGARATFAFAGGRLSVPASTPGRVDCRISSDPAAFLLITYGRTGLLGPVLSGRLLASGRKPWLGLTLPRRFRRP